MDTATAQSSRLAELQSSGTMWLSAQHDMLLPAGDIHWHALHLQGGLPVSSRAPAHIEADAVAHWYHRGCPCPADGPPAWTVYCLAHLHRPEGVSLLCHQPCYWPAAHMTVTSRQLCWNTLQAGLEIRDAGNPLSSFKHSMKYGHGWNGGIQFLVYEQCRPARARIHLPRL